MENRNVLRTEHYGIPYGILYREEECGQMINHRI